MKTKEQFLEEHDELIRWSTLQDEDSHMSPLVTNSAGGVQSQLKRDFTLVPQDALAEVARVLYNGSKKYGSENWRQIPTKDHLNHAMNHISLYLAGNAKEDHLSHATTRMMMALEMEIHSC